MRKSRRISAVIVVCGLLAVIVAGIRTGGVQGQIVLQPGIEIGPDGRPIKKQPTTTGSNPAQLSAIKLEENPDYRKAINVARDCINDRIWGEAITALQLLLDLKEDHYVQVRERDASGKETVRWASVKYEANNLLNSMPDEGLDAYEQRFGAKAKMILDEAKKKGDRDGLAEVSQKYLHTRAGIEANDLLATYFLDRGHFFMAALRFEKLLNMKPERAKTTDLTLFKAALSYRRAGDTKNADDTWKRLEPKLRAAGGLPIGGNMVPVAALEQALKEIPQPLGVNPHDWPYVRGNQTNTAQANGSPPLLDNPQWRRDLILDKMDETGEVEEKGREAKNRLDTALAAINGMNNVPIIPGTFPIAANRLLIYRSHSFVCAVYLKDEFDAAGKQVAKAGQIAWKSTDLEGALANVLAWDRIRPTLDGWLNQYQQIPPFISLLWENSLIGSLSTDHQYAYAIDDLAVPCPPNVFQPFIWQGGQVPNEVKPLIMGNTLNAFNLNTGQHKWRLGTKEDSFADSHFLGPPISVGGKLYVLNEKNPGVGQPMADSELRLVCIDPYKMAGQHRPYVVEPVQFLGRVQQNHRVTHDISRRTNACYLAYGEGILVCPTNAGEVLGVDLLSRSLAWAYPYREQAPPPLPFQQNPGQPFPIPQPQNPKLFGTTTGSNWKSAPPAIAEGKVIFTAPDASSVHCINLRDGTPVWKRRQADGDLYMAGVFNSKVVIVGRNHVRALSLKTGDMVWYVATGDMPSGQGVASKNIYYLPLKKGEILALDLERGAIKAHNRAKTPGKAAGNLVFHEGAVVSQTALELTAYPQLIARLAQADLALKADPNNPEKLVERGELLLADGQVQASVDDLQKALSFKPAEPLLGRAKDGMYEALTDLLQADFNGASVKYLDEYRDLSKLGPNPQEQQLRQARFFRIVGQGREAQGNLVEAFQMYRSFGELPIHRDQGVASLDDPSHKVPTNVWLRGRISAMIGKAPKEQRDPLEKKIAEEWKTVAAKNDVNAIRSFVDMFDVPFGVGRDARIRLAENIMERGDKGSYLEAELSLQQLRGTDYRQAVQSGGRALAALAALEEKKGTNDSLKLAAAYYRDLRRDFAKAAVRDDLTGTELFNEMAADKRFLPYLEEPSSNWGDAKIAAKEIPVGNFNAGLQGFIFQPEGDLTPMMRHHRLVLDPSNQGNPQLRLVDMTNNSVRWTQNLGNIQGAQPANQVNFQFFQYLYQQGQANQAFHPNAKFRFYQVKGHLMVFQVGTHVYCLDADNAKILWHQPLVEANLGGQPQMMVQQVMPDQEGYLELIVWNQFNGQRTRLPIGHVGAVQANYVALVTHKGLSVHDPIRGTMLWKKMDVQPSTRVFGDEQYLFMVDSADGESTGAGRVLRAGDGASVDCPDFGSHYQNRIRIMGRRILSAFSSQAGVEVKLYDIPTGKTVWTKKFDPRAVVLRTEDPGLTGVIETNGRTVVLDAETGAELMDGNVVKGQIKQDDLKALTNPLLLADADRFYVALNQSVDGNKVSGGVLSNNFSNGLRCQVVNGWFAAFQRKDGSMKTGDRVKEWKKGDFAWHSYKPLINQMVILEQFESLPVLIFSSRYNELINGGAGGNRWVSVTQSLNKRSGKVIWDPGNRPSNSAAQFYAFNFDPRGGAVNMIGFGGTLQHYIDDGRKAPDVPGAPMPGAGGPQPGLPGADGVIGPPGVLPAPGVRRPIMIRPVEIEDRPIRRVLPALPDK